jgi:hypothetical protein
MRRDAVFRWLRDHQKSNERRRSNPAPFRFDQPPISSGTPRKPEAT